MRSSHRPAFTLFEVLITIAIFLALVATMSAFLYDLLVTRGRLLGDAARQRAAATLIERVEADLLACLVGDAAHGAGVGGDEANLRILTRSVPVSLCERGPEAPEVFADLELSEYRFDREGGQIEGRRSVHGLADAAAAPFETFGSSLGGVRFRFHDGQGWRDRFDSLEADRLPGAVEVAIWYVKRSDEGTERLGDEGGRGPVPPDRLRVIVIPDSEGEGESAG